MHKRKPMTRLLVIILGLTAAVTASAEHRSWNNGRYDGYYSQGPQPVLPTRPFFVQPYPRHQSSWHDRQSGYRHGYRDGYRGRGGDHHHHSRHRPYEGYGYYDDRSGDHGNGWRRDRDNHHRSRDHDQRGDDSRDHDFGRHEHRDDHAGYGRGSMPQNSYYTPRAGTSFYQERP